MLGLKGLVGQNMAGRKSFGAATLAPLGSVSVTTGASSITASRSCQALIFAWGAGASGGANGASSASATGAFAGFKRVRLNRNQVISYSVGTPGAGVIAGTTNGNNGGDTTITLPSGQVLTAPGGRTNSGTTPATPATAAGWDTARLGGIGATGNNPGSPGDQGGAGGASDGSTEAGGGGAAGFSDLAGPDLLGGAGANGSNSGASPGSTPGGGSGVGGGVNSAAGGNGRVIIWLIRLF